MEFSIGLGFYLQSICTLSDCPPVYVYFLLSIIHSSCRLTQLWLVDGLAVLIAWAPLKPGIWMRWSCFLPCRIICSTRMKSNRLTAAAFSRNSDLTNHHTPSNQKQREHRHQRERTSGQILDVVIENIGGHGSFTKEIERWVNAWLLHSCT